MDEILLPFYLRTAPLLSAGDEWANLEWEWESGEASNLFLWAGNQASYPKAYFFSSYQQTRFFAAGIFKTLPTNKDEMNQFWEQMKVQPNSFLIGGQAFFSQTDHPESMWDNIRPHFYFVPRLYFRQSSQATLKIGLNLSHLESLDYQERKILPFDFVQFFSSMQTSGATSQFHFLAHKSTPDKNTWTELIRHFSGEKVVFARRLSLNCDQSPRQFLEDKWLGQERTKPSNIFWLELSPKWFFLSFSPERLFSLQKNVLAVDVLAGTMARGSNKETDQKLADELRHSAKDHHEHKFVLDEIMANLCGLGLKPELLFSGQILKLAHVQHVHSQWQAETPQHLSPFAIISALHPTPAVGGYPRHIALKQIAESEGYERGLYAAPVGVMSADYSEILVAIRSALSEEANLHIFAGAGIVRESDPESEWQETAHKMRNFVPLDLSLSLGANA
ncbi:MAG: isochorismate synthase [Bdellovibrio sp.]|nr:isochorismate synthase [Bdellovibrio sp.]